MSTPSIQLCDLRIYYHFIISHIAPLQNLDINYLLFSFQLGQDCLIPSDLDNTCSAPSICAVKQLELIQGAVSITSSSPWLLTYLARINFTSDSDQIIGVVSSPPSSGPLPDCSANTPRTVPGAIVRPPDIRRPDQQVPIERQRAVPGPIVRLPHRSNLYTTPRIAICEIAGSHCANDANRRPSIVLREINFGRCEPSVLFDGDLFRSDGVRRGGRGGGARSGIGEIRTAGFI